MVSPTGKHATSLLEYVPGSTADCGSSYPNQDGRPRSQMRVQFMYFIHQVKEMDGSNHRDLGTRPTPSGGINAATVLGAWLEE